MSDLVWIVILIFLAILFIVFSILATRQYYERNSCANSTENYCFDDWQCDTGYLLMGGAYSKLSEFNDWISTNCVNGNKNCCDALCLNCSFRCGIGGEDNPCSTTNTAPDLSITCPTITQ